MFRVIEKWMSPVMALLESKGAVTRTSGGASGKNKNKVGPAGSEHARDRDCEFRGDKGQKLAFLHFLLPIGSPPTQPFSSSVSTASRTIARVLFLWGHCAGFSPGVRAHGAGLGTPGLVPGLAWMVHCIHGSSGALAPAGEGRGGAMGSGPVREWGRRRGALAGRSTERRAVGSETGSSRSVRCCLELDGARVAWPDMAL